MANTHNGAHAGNGAAPPDATDISALWIKTGEGDPLTHEVMHNVPIGKPRDFFRTHIDPAYRQRCEICIVKSENIIGEQYYLVGPAMQGQIEEARSCILACVIDRTCAPRLWPLSLPKAGDQDNVAWATAREVARAGLDRWVKLVWRGRAFVSREAEPGYAPAPDFSHLQSFDDLVMAAFGVHGIIQDETHPVYRALLGLTALPGLSDDASRL
jgi:hypothetical protein